MVSIGDSISAKANPHRVSAATQALVLTLPLPLECIVMLGNGVGIDFLASGELHHSIV